MAFKIALAQCSYPERICFDIAENASYDELTVDFYKQSALTQIEGFAERAKNAHANLLVLPEYMMCPYDLSAEEIRASAECLDAEFITNVKKIARDNKIWIICSMNERNSNTGESPFNTLVVIDVTGKIQSSYRKKHLFDCGESCESESYSPGRELFSPIKTPFGKIGLGTCYDLRFPEVAREQCIKGADILIYPAAWYDGENKIEQWHALLKSRAIENDAYVVGVCRCDSGYIGNSCVYKPNGKLIALANRHDCLLTADVRPDLVTQIRAKMPVLEHAKFALA